MDLCWNSRALAWVYEELVPRIQVGTNWTTFNIDMNCSTSWASFHFSCPTFFFLPPDLVGCTRLVSRGWHWWGGSAYKSLASGRRHHHHHHHRHLRHHCRHHRHRCHRRHHHQQHYNHHRVSKRRGLTAGFPDFFQVKFESFGENSEILVKSEILHQRLKIYALIFRFS